MTKQTETKPAASPIAASKAVFVLASTNPKKPGSMSAARFALYATNPTVAQYVAACVALGQPNAQRNATADIAWDLAHGYIAHEAPKPAAK